MAVPAGSFTVMVAQAGDQDRGAIGGPADDTAVVCIPAVTQVNAQHIGLVVQQARVRLL